MLIRAANPPDAAGILADGRGRLFEVSLLAQRVSILDPASGLVLQSFGPEQGIITPDDLALAADGTAYITSILSGKILRLTPAGAVSQVAQLPPGVDGIAMSPDGRLFVSQFLFGDSVFEVDPNGLNPPRLIVSGIPGMEAGTVGPDGAYYVSIFFGSVVLRIDVDTGATSVAAGGFTTPIAVKFSPSGEMVVVESDSGKVLRVNADGSLTLLAQTPAGADNLAFDRCGRLFVSNNRDGSIVEVLEHGKLRYVVRPGLVPPGGIAVTGSGDTGTLKVVTLSAIRDYSPRTGRLRGVTVQSFSDPFASVSAPFTIAPFGSQYIVTSWVANLVQIWDAQAGRITAVYPDFAVPMNGIGFRGDLVVAELGTGQVTSRSPGSSDKTVLAEDLFAPVGLAADRDNVWVSDWASGVIWQIVAEGERLVPPVPIASGLAMPEGLALLPDGDLLAVETGLKRLVRINQNSGAISVVASNLPIGGPAPAGAPPTWLFNGVAADDMGGIYLGLDTSGGLLKIVPASLAADLLLEVDETADSGW
jgi:sugar lactone lactonase YvrE